MENIELTKHAYKRMKERCGTNKKASLRLAGIAYDKGIKHKDVKGRFEKLFTYLYFQGFHANNITIYGEHIYVFHDNKLITVMNLKNTFKKYL